MKTSQRELRQYAGQLIIMGINGTEMTPHMRHFIAGVQPGGIILFKRNIESATQCYDFLAESRRIISAPLFTCVDLEGGSVDRLRELVAHTHSQFDVGASRKKALFCRHGELLGAEARAFGFNTDFAPVSDLGFPASHRVLGSRTVSPDPEQTIAYIHEFLNGLQRAGVLGCGKHFPGLGEANLDSHLVMPSIHKIWDDLWQQDLLPYRELHKQFAFVMTAHAAYPEVVKETVPASLSHFWVTKVLREKIGYRGLILADDLEMGGALAVASIESAAVQTIRAGSDMFLVCHKEDDVVATYEAVVRECEKDGGFTKLVATAANRILSFKKKAKELKSVSARPTEKAIERLRDALSKFDQQLAKAKRS